MGKTKKNQRGLGGIEPPTSPTLKENHTTRPKARREVTETIQKFPTPTQGKKMTQIKT